MSKQVKAILTIIAGTIGVGFLALPYSIYKFGTFWGIVVLLLVGVLTLVTNLTYSDIITSDKGNRQIPGYSKKYLGEGWAHVITVVIIVGSLGILLAFGMIAGSALEVIFTSFDVDLSPSFFGLIFVIFSLFVMKYGMQVIARVSSWAVLVLILAIVFLITISIPNIDSANVSSPDFQMFPIIFGVSIFAMYSAGSIPVIDELIGYNRTKYQRAVVIATIMTLLIYIIFGGILSLSLGESVTSELVDAFGKEQQSAAIILSVLTLLSTFTSFVIVANGVKEVLNYDYKVPSNTATLMLTICLIVFLILEISNFDTLISVIGNIALALQSLFIFAIWFRSQRKVGIVYKFVVGICGMILVGGMLMQI